MHWLSLIDDVTGTPVFVNLHSVERLTAWIPKDPGDHGELTMVHFADGRHVMVRCSMQDIATLGGFAVFVIDGSAP